MCDFQAMAKANSSSTATADGLRTEKIFLGFALLTYPPCVAIMVERYNKNLESETHS